MILRLARQPGRLRGADGGAVVEGRGPQPGQHRVQGEGDQERAVDPAELGCGVAGVGLDQLAERLAHLHRRRAALHPGPLLARLLTTSGVGGAVDVAGGSEGEEQLVQHPALGLGDGEPPVRYPVGVEGQREAPLLRGLALRRPRGVCGRSLRRPGVRSGSGRVRRGGPGRRGRSRLRTRPAPPQPAPAGRCRGRRGGPPTRSVMTRAWSAFTAPAARASADPVPPRLERGGEAYLPGDHVLAGAGGVGGPDRGRGAPGLGADLHLVGVGEDGVLVGREPGLQVGQGDDGLARHRRIQREQRAVRPGR